jgi:hypothetical protein
LHQHRLPSTHVDFRSSQEGERLLASIDEPTQQQHTVFALLFLSKGMTMVRWLKRLLVMPPPWLGRVAWSVARIARIIFLIGSVYELGHRQGIIEASRWASTSTSTRPAPLVVNEVLVSLGVAPELVDVVAAQQIQYIPQFTHDHRFDTWTTDHSLVSHVGYRVVAAAYEAVRQKLKWAEAHAHWTMPALFSFRYDWEDWYLHRWHPTVRRWRHANEWLAGGDGNNNDNKDVVSQLLQWEYAIVQLGRWSLPQRAAVAEGLPRRFYVTESMLLADPAASPDELAFVLGRERTYTSAEGCRPKNVPAMVSPFAHFFYIWFWPVSHAMLGHDAHVRRVETILQALEILALCFVPAPSSFLAVVAMVGLPVLRRGAVAGLRRHHVHQADLVGLEVAARSCHDPAKASEMLDRTMSASERAAHRMPTVATAAKALGRAILDPRPTHLARILRLNDHANVEEKASFITYRRECELKPHAPIAFPLLSSKASVPRRADDRGVLPAEILAREAMPVRTDRPERAAHVAAIRSLPAPEAEAAAAAAPASSPSNGNQHRRKPKSRNNVLRRIREFWQRFERRERRLAIAGGG